MKELTQKQKAKILGRVRYYANRTGICIECPFDRPPQKYPMCSDCKKYRRSLEVVERCISQKGQAMSANEKDTPGTTILVVADRYNHSRDLNKRLVEAIEILLHMIKMDVSPNMENFDKLIREAKELEGSK